MIDIGESLASAAATGADWSATAALEKASYLKGGSMAVIDWDGGAGENWVRVIEQDQVVALVSAIIPVALARSDIIGKLGADIFAIVVDDFENAEMFCSSAILEHVFGLTRISAVLDPDRFSANELWFATI